nr:SEC-C domain-containing protein [Pseudopedobacter sp.]
MLAKSLFERDFKEVEKFFPKLGYSWSSKYKTWIINGELDICDSEGVYWNTFNIGITVPQSYPHCIPVIIERSEIIPRDIDWHISQEGLCCVDVSPNLIAMSKRGIHICDFIKRKIYPYFANQIYKLSENKYADKEYAHHIQGIIQYYVEDLNISDEKTILLVLQQIISMPHIGRNQKCPCGSEKKIKNCHQLSVETIKSFGEDRIKSDLNNIKDYITNRFS